VDRNKYQKINKSMMLTFLIRKENFPTNSKSIFLTHSFSLTYTLFWKEELKFCCLFFVQSDVIAFMLRYHIRLAENPLNTVEDLLSKLTQFQSEETTCTLFTLNKTTFPYFYKVLLEELTHIFSKLGIPRGKHIQYLLRSSNAWRINTCVCLSLFAFVFSEKRYCITWRKQ
jgi:hypothetical protein